MVTNLLHCSLQPSEGQLVNTAGSEFGNSLMSRLLFPPPLLSWLLLTVVLYLWFPIQREAPSVWGIPIRRELPVTQHVCEQEPGQ